MSLRLFCDHCVPSTIIESLQQAGHQVFRLRDMMPVESPDSEVIAKAQELDVVLISLDNDFADIVAYPPQLDSKESAPFRCETIRKQLRRCFPECFVICRFIRETTTIWACLWWWSQVE